MENQNAEMNKEYSFRKFPENIRQVGETGQSNCIYIEDYVITYIHQIFQKKQEEALVILLGTVGEDRVHNIPFVYGAVMVEVAMKNAKEELTEQKWQEIHQQIYQHFTGAQILGWGCSVSMRNSQTEEMQQYIQNTYFQKEGMLFFWEDMSEKEEKIFCFQSGEWIEQSGYFIFYQKNPLMQDYMLLGKEEKSFEAEYNDKVTANVRAVVHRREEEKSSNHLAGYSAVVLLVLLTVLGANLLMQSTKKIDNLEKTIETLSNAATTVTEVPAISQEPEKKASAQPEKVKSTGKPQKEERKETPSKETDQCQSGEKNRVKVSEKDTVKKDKSQEKTVKEKREEEKTKTREKQRQSKKVKNKKEKDENKKVVSVSTKNVKGNKETTFAKRKNASYVVRSGDTLSQIVWRQYHTMACMKLVKKANGIKNGDKIREGQKLILPAYKG